MERYCKEYINRLAKKYYDMFISTFGLNNGLKIHAQLGRSLRAEKKRREGINHT